MKGADAVICAIGSSGFNPKGPKTVDYEVTKHPCVAAVCLHAVLFDALAPLCITVVIHSFCYTQQPHFLCAAESWISSLHLACDNTNCVSVL
jgi:hypothetical protein